MESESNLDLALRSYLQQDNLDALPSILQFWTSTRTIDDEPALDTVLHHAISIGDTAGVQAILDAGAPPTLRESQDLYYTPLLNAARNGRRDIARLLWEHVGPNTRFYPSESGNPARAGEISCIQIAAAHGYTALVADFLDMWDGWTPDETRRTRTEPAVVCPYFSSLPPRRHV